MIKKSENFIFSEQKWRIQENIEILISKNEKKWKIQKTYVYIYAIFINKSNLQKKIETFFNANEYWK